MQPPQRFGRWARRSIAWALALLAASGCSQWRAYQCERDIVRRNEPYLTDADREDSEALARQTCRER